MARLRNAKGVTVNVSEEKVANLRRTGFSAVEDAPEPKKAPAKRAASRKTEK